MNVPVAALALSALCVAANAFFVAAEFAMAKARPSLLEALAQKGDVKSRRALDVLSKLDAYLSATQLGITLASLALGWLGEPAFASLLSPLLTAVGLPPKVVHGVALVIAFSLITLAHIVVGELAPKTLAIQRPETIARQTAIFLRAFYFLTYPALYTLNRLSNWTLRALRLANSDTNTSILSADEIRVIIQTSFRAGALQDRTKDLLERVLRGTDRPVRAVMVPRVDMVGISHDQGLENCLDLVRRHGHSRYPLLEDGDPDRILGYVYVKDLLVSIVRAGESLQSLKRDILFVPENRRVGDVLTEFQRTKIPMAIVVDEYGGTSGLVTVEDLVEEIVGDIQDELDLERPKIRSRPDGSIVVDGMLPVGELVLDGLHLEPQEGADTVGGYVVAALGRLAHPGDRVRVGTYDAVVEDVRKRRVSRVALIPRPESKPPTAAPLSLVDRTDEGSGD